MERRALKRVQSAGVLAALVLATSGVVAGGLASGSGGATAASLVAADGAVPADLAGAGAAPAVASIAVGGTRDLPLVNPALAEGDLVRITPASRSMERSPLLEGEGVTFTVTLDGESRQITSVADTLGEALAAEGIALGWEDDIDADLAAPVADGAEVHIARATSEYVTEQVVTPHGSEKRETDALLVGTTRVAQKGVDGDTRVTSQVRYVDGSEVDRTTVLTTEVTAPVTEIIEVGTRKPAPAAAASGGSSSSGSGSSSSSSSSGSSGSSGSSSSGGSASSTSAQYTLSQFMRAGVINWGGYKFTYYSQSVLPGGGLNIPGRHVNADGYVADGDGYIVLANSAPKGTVINTPFGYQGKVYDRGTTGNHYDVYIR